MSTPPYPADVWLEMAQDGVLHLGGTLDERSCSHVGPALLSQLCLCPDTHVLDLVDVRALSVQAIRLIQAATHLTAAHGARLEVVCPPDGPSHRSLTAAGLGDHLVTAT